MVKHSNIFDLLKCIGVGYLYILKHIYICVCLFRMPQCWVIFVWIKYIFMNSYYIILVFNYNLISVISSKIQGNSFMSIHITKIFIEEYLWFSSEIYLTQRNFRLCLMKQLQLQYCKKWHVNMIDIVYICHCNILLNSSRHLFKIWTLYRHICHLIIYYIYIYICYVLYIQAMPLQS